MGEIPKGGRRLLGVHRTLALSNSCNVLKCFSASFKVSNTAHYNKKYYHSSHYTASNLKISHSSPFLTALISSITKSYPIYLSSVPEMISLALK